MTRPERTYMTTLAVQITIGWLLLATGIAFIAWDIFSIPEPAFDHVAHFALVCGVCTLSATLGRLSNGD